MIIDKPAYTSGTDVVSLADMKLFLRVDGSDEDTTITALLNAAVTHISDYTNRHFTGDSDAKFYLEKWRSASLAFGPVTRISAVKYYDRSGTLQTLDASKWYAEKGQTTLGACTSTTRQTLRNTTHRQCTWNARLAHKNLPPFKQQPNCLSRTGLKIVAQLSRAHLLTQCPSVFTACSTASALLTCGNEHWLP